jgi:metal-responsive CopG/Arc/MetJ family transcriptional regulator
MKERLSITIDSDLFTKVEKISKEENIPRSKIIMEALKLWERRKTESLMRKGYLDSATEDLDLSEFDLEAGNEVMN